MTVPTLPIPNPHEWGTREAAAARIGVDARTISRMIEDGRLTAHRINCGPGEHKTLLWWPEVVAYAEVRRAAAEGVTR